MVTARWVFVFSMDNILRGHWTLFSLSTARTHIKSDPFPPILTLSEQHEFSRHGLIGPSLDDFRIIVDGQNRQAVPVAVRMKARRKRQRPWKSTGPNSVCGRPSNSDGCDRKRYCTLEDAHLCHTGLTMHRRGLPMYKFSLQLLMPPIVRSLTE